VNELARTVADVKQSRSRFQLEHFVIGQHDTAEMRFMQICLELEALEYSLATMKLEARKAEIEIERLRASGDAVDAIDAEIKGLGLQQATISLQGMEREAAILRDLFDESPKFTREQIERAQPEYWRARLLRQTVLQATGHRLGVGWAQLDAHRQAGDLEQVLALAESPEPAALPK
jgi:hypothetical protein